MNREQFTGICRQVAGTIGETWGDATGNPMLVAAGRNSRIAGKIQQRDGRSIEESARQLEDFLYRNRNWIY